KNGWQNRNRIKTAGGPRWLTVPVHAHLGTPIRDVTIDTTQQWRERHRRVIEQAYAKAPHLERYHDAVVAFYRQDWDRLAPLAVASSRWLAEARSEEHTSELQSRGHLVCRLLLEKKND